MGTNYLTTCFSDRWDELLFNHFPGTDACLVIHNVDEFSERLHTAAELALPDWAGIDGPIVYGGRSELGLYSPSPFNSLSSMSGDLHGVRLSAANISNL
ncbi:MAG: hypothetical protein ACXV79_00860 [Methylobacter sp.]